jgi:hypothetical protein
MIDRAAFWLLIAIAPQPLLAHQAAIETLPHAKPSTKLEAFNSDRGRLLIRDFYKLPTPYARNGSMTMDAVILTDLARRNSLKGFRIQITEVGSPPLKSYSLLDADEAAELVRALRAIAGMSSSPSETESADHYAETEFKTNGDLSIGFLTSKGKRMAYCSSGTIGKATIFFDDLASLTAIADSIEAGVKLLASK